MPEVATMPECPDGQHRWTVVREYLARDYFAVTGFDHTPDGLMVSVNGDADSEEIVKVHSERIFCLSCPTEGGDVTVVDYQ
jgi:hypothetical protein